VDAGSGQDQSRLLAIAPQLGQETAGQFGHPMGMTPGIRIAEIDGISHALQEGASAVVHLLSVLEGSIDQDRRQDEEAHAPQCLPCHQDAKETEKVLRRLRCSSLLQ